LKITQSWVNLDRTRAVWPIQTLLWLEWASNQPTHLLEVAYFSSGTALRIETGGASRSIGKRNFSGERTI
jgi:hypothetical protein